jgi:hypothetical protein
VAAVLVQALKPLKPKLARALIIEISVIHDITTA